MKKLITKLLLKIATTESSKLLRIRRTVDLIFLVLLGFTFGLLVQPFWAAIVLSVVIPAIYIVKHGFDLMIERVVIGRETMNMMTGMLANISQNMGQTLGESAPLEEIKETLETSEETNV